ncbi:MAG: asparagine synthetase A [Candidatus Micrarchaeia archaeon]
MQEFRKRFCGWMDKVLDAKLRILSKILLESVNFFNEKGFIQLLPVMLGKSTDPLGPDPNSSLLKTPSIEYAGQTFYTMNSMILHKQVAVRELNKIFIMSPNIRLEKLERGSTGKHLFEFTQLDFEIADAKMNQVMKLVEEYLKRVSSRTRVMEEFGELGIEPFKFKTPFPSYTTHELEEKYGKEWEIPASKDNEQPFWAICHKREFYDKEDKSNPGHYLNYDLVYPQGFGEALSGGEREHEYERIIERMGKDRLEKSIYKFYIEEAKKGFVASAGAGIGMERLARFMTKTKHIGDVQLFRRVPGENVAI